MLNAATNNWFLYNKKKPTQDFK